MISYEKIHLDLVFNAIERLCGEAEAEDRGEIRVTPRDDLVIVSWLYNSKEWIVYIGSYTKRRPSYRGVFEDNDINLFVKAESYNEELFWISLNEIALNREDVLLYPSKGWLREKFPDTWQEDNVITRDLAIDYVFWLEDY